MPWKRTTPVRALNASDDTTYPSFLDSWLVWRQQLTTVRFWDVIYPDLGHAAPFYQWKRAEVIAAFYKHMGKPNDGICPQCNDAGRIDIEYGPGKTSEIWCLCQLVGWGRRKFFEQQPYTSRYQDTTFNEFSIKRIDGVKSAHLALAKKVAQDFTMNPGRWLVLSGPQGTGKTHLLRAIANNYGPGISLFLRTTDFIAQLMSETRNKDNGNVEKYMDAVRTAPILLLDDLGQEHLSEYGRSLFLSTIDYRYNHREEYPTAFTTNDSKVNFQKLWGVLGDRIADEANEFVYVDEMSYRQRPLPMGDGGQHAH